MTDIIKHRGTVEHIIGSHIQVRIVQTSACSSCTAKSFCSSSESKEKLIDIYNVDASKFQLGQEVIVYGATSLGMRAVWLAFGLPFIILIAALFLLFVLTEGDEVITALLALLALVPYYLILYAFRGHLKKKLSFKIMINKQ